ncbi:4-coumarate--CoA ligase 3-like [Vanessa cardui]|uniref:4-coumarate--CoA ligase 3-like n=1 Tax=Vanessa cardui TaxID=171605 RepID=UPI001F13E89B|nr:4-coumarate--CoA ligase 3-like [Vanessa cardui]
MAHIFRRSAYQIIYKNKLFLTPSSRQKSTDANILKSVYKEFELTCQTVRDFAWQNLDRWPDKTFTVCAVTGHGYTYAQAYKMSICFGASLRSKLKLQNDDKVAVILPNVPEYPCIVLGILEAGGIASIMNPAYTPHELKHQLKLIECKAIVSSKVSYPNIVLALKEMKLDIPIILIDNDVPENTIKFAEFAEDMNVDTDCLKKVKRTAKDIAILPFSSGTTGFPKAVELSHESINTMNEMILDPEVIGVEEATGSFQSVTPAVLPFFHIFGFNALMLNLMSRGIKLVTMPTFKADLFLETIVRHKANHLYVVPPMMVFLGKHPAVTPKYLETIQGIICGAAPISSHDATAVLNKNKNIIFRQGYGLTETCGGISVGNRTDSNHASVGHVFGGAEVKIADLNTFEALGPGQEGEICYRGKNVMNGYYKNDEATKEVMTEDGWYKTGDIGKYDENKYLYVTDRLKELIKVKGFQVPPAELEMVLRTHPKILDCAVMGVPDPISGEVPKAFVVTQAGESLKTEEVLEFVNSKVVSFKNIKDVQFVEAIPKNPAGKILRKDLKAKYC